MGDGGEEGAVDEIDSRFQRSGYGRATVKLIAEVVRAEGATELLTSYVEGDNEPWPFYERLGFSPTGERDDNGEVILVIVQKLPPQEVRLLLRSRTSEPVSCF